MQLEEKIPILQILQEDLHLDLRLPNLEPQAPRPASAAAVATNAIGASQKIGLSASEGTIISFEISFSPSAANCRIPSILPA